MTICLNEVGTIEHTITSLLNQTYHNFEYIIVDGGSTDGTLDKIKLYSKHIDIVISEKDRGRYHAMNKGLACCTGEYIWFLNGGDSLYNPDVLQDIVSSNSNADIIFGDRKLINWGKNKIIKISREQAEINDEFLHFRTIPHQASTVKRCILESLGGFDEHYTICADYDFFLRAFLVNKVDYFYLPQVIAVQDCTGISYREKRQTENERLEIQQKYFSKPIYNLLKTRLFFHRYRDNQLINFLLKIGYQPYRVWQNFNSLRGKK